MAEPTRPLSKETAPDPSNSYERSHPEREAGMGRLDTNKNATPASASDDHSNHAVKNAQDGTRQINAHDDTDPHKPAAIQPDHSMKDEEPLGWDQAPQGATKPEDKRHPRTGGKGGTPDAGEPNRTS